MKSEQIIVMRSVEDLIPYIKNSRTHSAEQVAQIAASIREFGFTNPVLIDGAGGIIAGHGRVLAALKGDTNALHSALSDAMRDVLSDPAEHMQRKTKGATA